MPKDPNEVGAMWKKTNDRGEYFSVSLDLEMTLALTGGDTGKVDLKVFPNDYKNDNPNAPDYRLKFYPKGVRTAPPAARPSPPAAAQPLLDDDIPF